jgi:hypothetical protein
MNRDRFLKIRVTESELAGFRARAGEAGMTVSDLIRHRLTGYRVRQTDSDKERLRSLARIGSNINQLARWANSRKAAAPALEIVLWLGRLVDTINHVAGEPEIREEPAHDD